MKFLLFSDLHHGPGIFDGGSYEDLLTLERAAKAAGCDFIIHTGDLFQGEPTSYDYVRKYNSLEVKTYHCLGNHETDESLYEDILELYGMPNNYYFFDRGGYRMVVLDPNYMYIDGEYLHFSLRNNFYKHEVRDYIPPEQLRWLEETLDSSPYPALIFSHQSIERHADGIKNRDAVLDVINRANKKHPGRVLAAFNGHYHRDYARILDGVLYMDVNSASFDYISYAHDKFPKEMRDSMTQVDHTLIYNDLLYATVTLEGNTVTVDGVESSFFMGVDSKASGNPPYDKDARPATARISSLKVTLG